MSTQPTVTIGTPERLFSFEELAFGNQIPTYDITPDSQRFVLPKRVQAEDADAEGESAEGPPPSIRIVRNWYEEFLDRE